MPLVLEPLRLPPPAPWRLVGAAPSPEDLSRWSEPGEHVRHKVDLADGSVALVTATAIRWVGPDGQLRARHPFPERGRVQHAEGDLYGELAPGVVLASFSNTDDLGEEHWWSAFDLRAGSDTPLPDVTGPGPACVVGGRIVLPGHGQSTERVCRVAVPGLVRLSAIPGRGDIVQGVDVRGMLLEIQLGEAPRVEDCGALIGLNGRGEVVTWNRLDGTARSWPVDGGAPSNLGSLNRNGHHAVAGAWGLVTVAQPRGLTEDAPLGEAVALVHDDDGAPVLTLGGLQRTCADPTGRFVGGLRSTTWVEQFHSTTGTLRTRPTGHRAHGEATWWGAWLVVGDRCGNVSAFDAEGATRWSTHLPPVLSLAANGDSVFCLCGLRGEGRELLRLDGASGEVRARANLKPPVGPTRLRVVGGWVYADGTPVRWDGTGAVQGIPGASSLVPWESARVALRLGLPGQAREVSVLDLETGTLIPTGVTGGSPCHVDVDEVAAVATAAGDLALIERDGEVTLFKVGARCLGLTVQGRRILAAFADGSCRWFDEGGEQGRFHGFTEQVWRLGFLGEGHAYAWGRGPHESWRRVDCATGRVVADRAVAFDDGPLQPGIPAFLNIGFVPVVRDLATGEERTGPTMHPTSREPLSLDAAGRLELAGRTLVGPLEGVPECGPMEAPRGLSVRVQGPQLLVEAEDGVQAQWTALVPLREARAFGDLVACLDVRGAVALFRLERAPSHQGEP